MKIIFSENGQISRITVQNILFNNSKQLILHAFLNEILFYFIGKIHTCDQKFVLLNTRLSRTLIKGAG